MTLVRIVFRIVLTIVVCGSLSTPSHETRLGGGGYIKAIAVDEVDAVSWGSQGGRCMVGLEGFGDAGGHVYIAMCGG